MKIVRSSEVPWADALTRSRFGNRRKPLGGERVSCGLWELAPGKRSFPLHRHHGTEEAMFVISGKAKVRTTDGETAIGPGDFVSFPTSGAAHQLVNDGSEPLVYLALGVPATGGVDVVEYPDSGKVACRYSEPSGQSSKRWVFEDKTQVDYFQGED